MNHPRATERLQLTTHSTQSQACLKSQDLAPSPVFAVPISLVLPPPFRIIYLPPSFLRLATPDHSRLSSTKRDTDFHKLDMYEYESGERLATVRSPA